MTLYVLRRLGLFAVGLLVTSLLVFTALRVLPGDIAHVIGGTKATPEQIATLRSTYGLDAPLLSQYTDWLSGLVRGDLGISLRTHVPISTEVAEKFHVTGPLCLMGITVALLLGLPAGIWSGLRHDRPSGAIVSAVTQGVAAVPVLWAGLLLILLLGKGVGLANLLPTQGFPIDGWQQPGRALQSLLLPALAIGLVEGAVILRFTRSAVIEALPQDYLRTAAAQGLTRTQALLRRGLPNVSLSVLSVIALQAASLVTGAVVVEALFALPGAGSMLVTDVANRDLIKVQSEILLLAALVLVVGLLVDITHRIIDPRQRRVVVV